MASEGDFDIGSLSASQQEALQQYTDVTSQEVKDAIPILERSQWNVQIAIAKFFDGEGPDLIAEAQAAHDSIPRATARHENLHESFLNVDNHPYRPATRPQTAPAPRVVPQSSSVYRTPFLVAVLFAPFRFGFKIFAGLFRSLFYFLSFLPQSIRPRFVASSISKGLRQTTGRRVTLPKETAQRFRRDFEEEYGAHGLPFFEGGHAQALDAAKTELKFLLTVLVSPENDETESFIRNTLLSPEVVNFISDPANNIILWGGNALDSEAYQVAREYNCAKYPFSCVVCLTPKEGSTRMGIVKRLVGPMTPESYIAGIQSAITKYGPDMNGVRAERAAQEMARNLRTQQDSAYERSLAADRERARQKREAAAAAAAAEKRAQEEAEAAARQQELRQKWREWRATTIAPEPDAGAKDTVRLALNMPASSEAGRVVRKAQLNASDEMGSFSMNKVLGSIKKRPTFAEVPKPHHQIPPTILLKASPRVVWYDYPGSDQEDRRLSSRNHADGKFRNNSVNRSEVRRHWNQDTDGGNAEWLQGDDVIFLPSIVEAAVASPAAAAECARLIRKFMSRDYWSKPSCQYNAIMLLRILADNPGPGFTQYMDKKFVDAAKELLRSGRDGSVRQILMETLDTFELSKGYDVGLGPTIAMWKEGEGEGLQGLRGCATCGSPDNDGATIQPSSAPARSLLPRHLDAYSTPAIAGPSRSASGTPRHDTDDDDDEQDPFRDPPTERQQRAAGSSSGRTARPDSPLSPSTRFRRVLVPGGGGGTGTAADKRKEAEAEPVTPVSDDESDAYRATPKKEGHVFRY
ncbi:hypothetical protein NEMBOFW57_001547 [Staphylotrichum longicolle]|uniref:VHS domain-containing protein n=1 Tax=Staphylotrichum longicolle TaxID=669026 RepID=A0AAD4I3W0_9PEZI|nr:hypothetical protein NEMBOFW57_001547 [Staphylotrichum longicolle]